MLKWLTENWGLKLISLVLAVALWHYATGEEGIEVTRQVPLDIVVKNSQMSVLKTTTRSVQVTFIAPRASLSDLTLEKIRAVHEIENSVNRAGEYSFRLEPREIRLQTPKVRITKIEPDAIQVALDELIVQKLPLEPGLEGEPAYGYKVLRDKIELNPNAALIEGPKGRLENLKSVKTEPIDLIGRIRAFRRTVNLELPPNVKLLSEPLIDVFIPIEEEFEERPVAEVPVKILSAGRDKQRIEVSPPKISFSVYGSKHAFEKFAPETVLAFAESSGLAEGEHEVPVRVVLPPEISLKQEAPLTVKVTIKK